MNASTRIARLRVALAEIASFEQAHNLTARNDAAERLFANPANRKFVLGAVTVETWHDPQSQNWITQTKDSEGNQVGEADLTGHRSSAAMAHCWALNQNMPPEEITEAATPKRPRIHP